MQIYYLATYNRAKKSYINKGFTSIKNLNLKDLVKLGGSTLLKELEEDPSKGFFKVYTFIKEEEEDTKPI